MDTPNTHKKLYRILPGKMIAGVCNGIAAYFDVDVTIVRVLFVLALFLTHGGMVLAYFVLMIIVPVEGTSAEAEQHHWGKWRAKMGHYERSAETYVYHPRPYRRGPSLIGEVAQVVFFGLVIYLLYTYVPQTQPFFDKVWMLIQIGWNWIVLHLNTPVK